MVGEGFESVVVFGEIVGFGVRILVMKMALVVFVCGFGWLSCQPLLCYPPWFSVKAERELTETNFDFPLKAFFSHGYRKATLRPALTLP